jgi:hypothetical protein
MGKYGEMVGVSGFRKDLGKLGNASRNYYQWLDSVAEEAGEADSLLAE